MKTTIDLVNDVFTLLNVPVLTGAISGKVYKHRRPTNSKKEDIVVNCLPVTGDQLQTAVVNINIHVANLKLQLNGTTDLSQPDHVRLNAIAGLVTPLIEDASINDLVTSVQQQTVIEEAEIDEHYINIRVNIFNINV